MFVDAVFAEVIVNLKFGFDISFATQSYMKPDLWGIPLECFFSPRSYCKSDQKPYYCVWLYDDCMKVSYYNESKFSKNVVGYFRAI